MSVGAVATRAATGASVVLPSSSGGSRELRLSEPVDWQRPNGPARSRQAYAAAHVVPVEGDPTAIDWDATLAVRQRLWGWGLGVAEAMDTAQRGSALSWPAARELVRRACADAAAVGGAIVAGVATDSMPAGDPVTLTGVRDAYLHQLEQVEAAGAGAVLMASRSLCATARDADDYRQVYAEVLDQAARPVLLHWLGEVFDPALRGYWGAVDPWEALSTVLAVIERDPAKVSGIKLSVLDAPLERELRRRLPEGVLLYTGDDLNYPDLVRGDESGVSHALLGVLDAIAPAAATALHALDADDLRTYDEVMGSTLTLARTLFEAPTPAYKTGLVLLAWLNGQQESFTMLGGAQADRGLEHLGRVLEAADHAGLLTDPGLAARRWGDLVGAGR
ncbi:MAG TPA: DUF993 family protein [Actinomycetales bacterium]